MSKSVLGGLIREWWLNRSFTVLAYLKDHHVLFHPKYRGTQSLHFLDNDSGILLKDDEFLVTHFAVINRPCRNRRLIDLAVIAD